MHTRTRTHASACVVFCFTHTSAHVRTSKQDANTQIHAHTHKHARVRARARAHACVRSHALACACACLRMCLYPRRLHSGAQAHDRSLSEGSRDSSRYIPITKSTELRAVRWSEGEKSSSGPKMAAMQLNQMQEPANFEQQKSQYKQSAPMNKGGRKGNPIESKFVSCFWCSSCFTANFGPYFGCQSHCGDSCGSM